MKYQNTVSVTVEEMYLKTDIGDIRVTVSGDNKTGSFNVSVFGKGKRIEHLEYPDNRTGAWAEYHMLCNLFKQVAAIHPLI